MEIILLAILLIVLEAWKGYQIYSTKKIIKGSKRTICKIIDLKHIPGQNTKYTFWLEKDGQQVKVWTRNTYAKEYKIGDYKKIVYVKKKYYFEDENFISELIGVIFFVVLALLLLISKF